MFAFLFKPAALLLGIATATSACDDSDLTDDAYHALDSNIVATPANGSRHVTGEDVAFAGKVSCRSGVVQVIADDRFLLGKPTIDQAGNWKITQRFNTAGIRRKISVVPPANCGVTVDLRITIQPTVSYQVERRVDSAGCSFDSHLVSVPTASTKWRPFVDGLASSATVATHGSDIGAVAVINAGYFSVGSGPLSYAKGKLGYESPSGNVKGPRGCLAIAADTKLPRIALSMGREFSNGRFGRSLFPAESDVACAGPILVEASRNVATAHVELENFQTSGIGPTVRLPRSAVCIRADSSLLLVVAQSRSVRSCGFSLPQLADYLVRLGCVDALNLDGGGSTAVWVDGVPPRYAFGIEDRPVFQVIGAVAAP
jgi:exopolysaccharide biosynthesis protein